jgi:hypothetical protein
MAKTLDEVKKQLSDLRTEELRLEAENFETRMTPLVKDSIGKTYAYRNNHSGGSEGRWDVFRKVKAVVFSEYNAWVICEECQLRADSGVPELTIHSDLIRRGDKEFPRPEMGWEPCDAGEFEACKRLVLEQLENPTLACARIQAY